MRLNNMSVKLDVANPVKLCEKSRTLSKQLLVTAGPSNCSPRVIAALGKPTLHIISDDVYQEMDDIKEMLKYVFQTTNDVTLALQCSGTGGLEAAIYNLVDPGEKVLIAIGGVWGHRLADMARIRNAEVITCKTEDGKVFTIEELEREIIKHKPVLLFVTHGESSAGTVQPLEGLGDVCERHNCLLAIDAVASLGGVPLFVDRWKIDVAVSATQKVLGAPPGLSYLTLSPKAVERMRSVKTPPPLYYNIFKICEIWNCFGTPRKYYYTFNSHLICAVKEALLEIVEEGLENTWNRHKKISERFWAGLEKMGLQLFIENPNDRLCTIHCISLPSDVKWPVLIDYLEKTYEVSIAFGIGPTLNKALRIGIMGYNARPEVVDHVLKVLDEGIKFCRSEKGRLINHTRSEVL